MSDGFEDAAEEVREGAPDWMVTFGDLMALLLCFFVLLLSFSETDRAKYKEVAGSLEKAFGIQRKTPAWDSPKGQSMISRSFDSEISMVEKNTEVVGKELKEKLDDLFRVKVSGIEVVVDDESVTIRLLGETTFESGKSEIREQMLPFLEDVGKFLDTTEGDILIAGHTDNVPVKGGPFFSNLNLSLARSASVADFFINRGIVAPQRVVTMGFGEHRPVESNELEEGRRKNRRVEIVLTRIPQVKLENGAASTAEP